MKDRIHPVRPQESLPLWHLYKQGHDAVCEVVQVPPGFECRFLIDGRFLYSHQFATSDEVMEWAFAEQARCRRDGWARTTSFRESMPASQPASMSA